MTELFMFSPLTWLLLAGALLSSPPRPVGRELARAGQPVTEGPKRPRDGPQVTLPRLLARFVPALGANRDRQVDRLAVAADIGLFAACIHAGLSTGTAAAAVADSADPATRDLWSKVAALLSVGVDPARAWGQMAGLPGLTELAGITRLSHRSGAAIATGCERIAEQLRSEAADSANAAAERAGVFIALPLAVCFLPGFIVLGLAPVVISLGLDLIG